MRLKTLVLLSLTLTVTQGFSQDEGYDSEPCQYVEEPEGYDPYRCYYPYSIYQNSKVRNPRTDDEDNYWPAKRDDSLIDALTR